MVAGAELETLIPIPLSAVPVAGEVHFALYLRSEREGYYPFVRGGGTAIRAADLERLRKQGIAVLYVEASEARLYQSFLRENLKDLLADESAPIAQRASVLNQVVRDLLTETIRSGNVNKIVEESKALGQHAVELICRPDFVAAELSSILYHDYGTFTHSANVAFYAVMLAKALGCSNRRELTSIATGALLHDIGKLDVPEAVITKCGRLDRVEIALVQRHPTTGFLKLQRRPELSFGELMMVYQHHERMDGSGYPVRLCGEEIHHWARTCAVADVFEALTSSRTYHAGISERQALETMEADGKNQFDQEMLACWKAIISSN